MIRPGGKFMYKQVYLVNSFIRSSTIKIVALCVKMGSGEKKAWAASNRSDHDSSAVAK